MLIVNKEMIKVLLKIVQTTDDINLKQSSERLLKNVGNYFPQLIKPETAQLCKVILESDQDIGFKFFIVSY